MSPAELLELREKTLEIADEMGKLALRQTNNWASSNERLTDEEIRELMQEADRIVAQEGHGQGWGYALARVIERRLT